MKKRIVLFVMVAVMLGGLMAGFATGCGGRDLIIQVGTESVEFYTQKMEEWAEAREAAGKEVVKVKVQGYDTGTAAGDFLSDTEAGADILTVAHDNLARLTAGSSAIAPIDSTTLLAQIAADNDADFQDAAKRKVQGTEYTFGVPYISQALVLYYNKSKVNAGEEQTWEGLLAAAKRAGTGVKAASFTGDDGFNHSWLPLAYNTANKKRVARLYEDGVLENTGFNTDEATAAFRFAQRLYQDPNGPKRPSSDGWETELENGTSIAVIGGAWNFNAASGKLGSNLGITVLPSFTVTAADVAGTNVAANTKFQAGSFFDAKIFVMKKESTYDKEILQDIMQFLSTKEVQEESFEAANNLPAYKNALAEFTALSASTNEGILARTQLEMRAHSIPQPFGKSAVFNTNYYSNGSPALIFTILLNDPEGSTPNYNTPAGLTEGLNKIVANWLGE